MDAFDGTAGRLGPRTYLSNSSVGAPYADPASYLPPEDFKTYQKWIRYSQKPPGQDYVLPSKDYFSLGKMQPFTGDLNKPGIMEGLIKVRALRRADTFYAGSVMPQVHLLVCQSPWGRLRSSIVVVISDVAELHCSTGSGHLPSSRRRSRQKHQTLISSLQI